MEKKKTATNPQKTTKTAPAKKPNASFKSKSERLKAKFFSSYYGHPIRDMKLICITGTTGKSTVAHYVHEILKSAGQHVAILASETEIKTSVLHKFFSDAWKAGASYVVVTAPAASLKSNVFYGLPITVAALTDFIPASLDAPKIADFLDSESTLFKMSPKNIVLNHDDLYYSDFKNFSGTSETFTYGKDRESTLHIDSFKLYKKGTEARLSLGSSFFTVASFLTGEPAISHMACATAIATALHISTDAIIEGIANYDPENL